MQGQANRIEDWGSPRMVVGGLGDDLIKRFWKWRSQAHASLAESKDGVTTPYFVDFSQNGPGTASSGLRGIPTGTSFGDDPAVVSKVRHDARLRNIPLVTDDNEVDAATGNPIGSWGIKQTYLQNTPAANFPPMNYKKYKVRVSRPVCCRSCLSYVVPHSLTHFASLLCCLRVCSYLILL